ncbi:MAG: DUF721 domain-containing protein [Desulfobulbaceae bacterium]|nr:DUF721 domain-containing protein [Desulfobulbaceae bacterium]
MAKPTPIHSLLNSLIASKGWKGRVELHRVFTFWDELVGADIARRAQPYVIRKGVLWVSVSDSVWMQQLHMLKEMFLHKINKRLKKEKFTDIRFQLDSTLGRPVVEGDSRAETPVVRSEPDKQSVEEFEKLLAEIEDEQIKNAMRKCWLKVGLLKREGLKT